MAWYVSRLHGRLFPMMRRPQPQHDIRGAQLHLYPKANTCSFFPIDFVKSFDSFLIEDGMSPRDFSSWWRENSARAKVSVSSTLSGMLGRRLH